MPPLAHAPCLFTKLWTYNFHSSGSLFCVDICAQLFYNVNTELCYNKCKSFMFLVFSILLRATSNTFFVHEKQQTLDLIQIVVSSIHSRVSLTLTKSQCHCCADSTSVDLWRAPVAHVEMCPSRFYTAPTTWCAKSNGALGCRATLLSKVQHVYLGV